MIEKLIGYICFAQQFSGLQFLFDNILDINLNNITSYTSWKVE